LHSSRPGSFVISLDFEMLWGVRDQADRESYGGNILGEREAIPRILDLFADAGISATWATVGMLFCESKDELIASMPEELPKYSDQALSSYRYLDEVGSNEKTDPYYFAPSLIEIIRQTPGQEIGTHTFSHYYCLEDGQSLAAFEADILAAQRLATSRGIVLRSIVFPRNQFDIRHVEACARLGITAYRGNPQGWVYRSTKWAEQTLPRRAARIADAYTGVLGPHTFERSQGSPANVPASHFLRPCAGLLSRLHFLNIATIKRSMTTAARTGANYHLWWHPHNFGRNLEANMLGLRQVIDHYRMLRDRYGMRSASMDEFA